MAQVIGYRLTGDYHQGNPPWSKRQRQIPKLTWSGDVVYKRSRHSWTQKDVERVIKAYVPEPDAAVDPSDWRVELTLFFQRATIAMLEKILYFLDEETVEEIYYTIYEILGRLFRIDTSYYTSERRDSLILNILQRVATLGGYEITAIKRK